MQFISCIEIQYPNCTFEFNLHDVCNQGSFVKDVKIFDLTLEGFGLESFKLENPVETTNTLDTTATNTL